MSRVPVILFLCGGRRVGLLQSFKAALAPFGGRVLTTDTEPWSPTSFVAHRTVRVAPCAETQRFCDDVVRLCEEENVSAIVPLNCGAVATMPALAGRTPATLIGGDAETVAITTDKRRTADHFLRFGLPTPAVSDRPGPGDLPLFRRYRCREGSVGARAIVTPEELAMVRHEPDQIFTRYLSGPEFSVDCYRGLDGTIHAAVPRLRVRVRAGEVEKAVTVWDDTLVTLARAAVGGLRFVGPATVQAIHQDGTFYLTEINLRYGGGVTLSIAAGADSPSWLVAELMGQGVPPPPAVRWGLGMCRHDQDTYFDVTEPLL